MNPDFIEKMQAPGQGKMDANLFEAGRELARERIVAQQEAEAEELVRAIARNLGIGIEAAQTVYDINHDILNHIFYFIDTPIECNLLALKHADGSRYTKEEEFEVLFLNDGTHFLTHSDGTVYHIEESHLVHLMSDVDIQAARRLLVGPNQGTLAEKNAIARRIYDNLIKAINDSNYCGLLIDPDWAETMWNISEAARP